MSDLIRRSALIKAFDPEHYFDWYTPSIIETINEQPTVDAVPVVHGSWIEPSHSIVTYIGHIHYATCTSCKRTIALDDEFGNFCPNCGAKMDGKKVQE